MAKKARGSRPMETSVMIDDRASGDKRMDMTQSLAKSAVGTEPPDPNESNKKQNNSAGKAQEFCIVGSK